MKAIQQNEKLRLPRRLRDVERDAQIELLEARERHLPVKAPSKQVPKQLKPLVDESQCVGSKPKQPAKF